MLITQLTPKGKTKMSVTFDEDVTLVVSNADVGEYGLEEGAEISQEMYEAILQAVKQEALRRCISLLQGMDYTKYALMQKLLRSGFPQVAVLDAVSRVEDAGLIDDLRYAEGYLRSHMPDRSSLRIRSDLAGKGVSEDVIEEAFRRWEKDAGSDAETSSGADGSPSRIEEAELKQIRRILEKRHYDPAEATREDTAKLIAYLQYRGYPISTIRKAVDT